MKNPARFFRRFVRVGAVLTVLAVLIPYRPVLTPSGRCMHDFDTFAYRQPWIGERWPTGEKNRIPPLAPWEYRQDARGAWARVKFSRLINGEQELWFLLDEGFSPQTTIVFNRDTKTWRQLSLSVVDDDQGNQFGSVFDFIADHDGQVWGLATQHEQVKVDGVWRDKIAIVQYRDEQDDFASVFIPDDAGFRLNTRLFDTETLRVDQQNRVWFIATPGEGYRFYVYDPRSESFEQLPDYRQSGKYFPHITISDDGDVYISSIVFDNWPLYYYPMEAEFARYDAENEQWVDLDLPDGFQPREGNLGFDPQGRLHIGTSAWRDTDATWHITYPYDTQRKDIFPRLELKLISSDGRFWFTRAGPYLPGTAWYDPATGEGCVFTNLTPHTIIEDHQQYLWMVISDEIYRLDLNAE